MEDDVLNEGNTEVRSLMESNDSALAISTLALYDYHLCASLICFDDELRF
jgi:hypothetical protein